MGYMVGIFSFGWRARAQRLEQMNEDLLAALADSIDALRQAHAETRDIAASLEAVSANLAELTERPAQPIGWKALRQWTYVGLLTTCAIFAAFVGASAFRGMPTTLEPTPMIVVGLELKEPAETPALIPVATKVVHSAEGNQVAYFVAVPKEYAGRAFTVRLRNGSDIDNFVPYDMGPGDVSIRDEDCGFGAESPARCQFISGRFPVDPNYRVDPCQPSSTAESQSTTELAHVAVEITGTLRRVRRSGLFNTSVTLPNFGGVFNLASPNGGSSWSSAQHTCWLYVGNPADDDPTFNVQPDVSKGRIHWWDSKNRQGPSDDEDYDDNIVVVTRSMYAEEWGTIGIAASGASVALAFCFFPIAYASTSEWRKRRRFGR